MALRFLILFCILALLSSLSLNLSILNTVYVFAAMGLYCLPSVIADARRHKNKMPISIINFFFGWTVIGWVVSLAWSLTNNTEKK